MKLIFKKLDVFYKMTVSKYRISDGNVLLDKFDIKFYRYYILQIQPKILRKIYDELELGSLSVEEFYDRIQSGFYDSKVRKNIRIKTVRLLRVPDFEIDDNSPFIATEILIKIINQEDDNFNYFDYIRKLKPNVINTIFQNLLDNKYNVFSLKKHLIKKGVFDNHGLIERIEMKKLRTKILTKDKLTICMSLDYIKIFDYFKEDYIYKDYIMCLRSKIKHNIYLLLKKQKLDLEQLTIIIERGDLDGLGCYTPKAMREYRYYNDNDYGFEILA